MTEKLTYRLFRFIKEERNLILFSFFFLLILFFYNNYPFVKSSCPADECEANMMTILETPVLQTLSKIIILFWNLKVESFLFANIVNIILWYCLFFLCLCVSGKLITFFRTKKTIISTPAVFLIFITVSIFILLVSNVAFRTYFSALYMNNYVENSRIYSFSINNAYKFIVKVVNAESKLNTIIFYYKWTGLNWYYLQTVYLMNCLLIIIMMKLNFREQVLLRRDFVCRKELLGIRWFFAAELFHLLISKSIFTDQFRCSFSYGLVLLYQALQEEIWFRSLIQNVLKKFTGKIHAAIVLQSLIFAVSHGQHYFNEVYFSLANIISVFFSGILYGYAKERYGLQWAWMLHFFYNILLASF